MKVRNITLNEAEEPTTLTVDMNIREAVLIARMVGNTSPAQRGEVQHDGGAVGEEVYSALSSLFNRFWDDGVQGVAR